MKSQSAMEYLMTYGWAILIIAVVLSVLFQLGVFSSGNFQPHAQPGACQVSRTVAGVSLEGQCNGLLPEYVASFEPGIPSMITIPDSAAIDPSTALTVSGWVFSNQPGTGSCTAEFVANKFTNPEGYELGLGWVQDPYGDIGNTVTFTQPDLSNSQYRIYGQWRFIALTFSPDTKLATVYVNYNGGLVSATAPLVSIAASTQALHIGEGCLPGDVSNVQLYNTSLSSDELLQLYLEGIGGAPIRPQNLVGWWPLNGNANDYSGNGNNGQPTGVTFSSSWEGSYTAP